MSRWSASTDKIKGRRLGLDALIRAKRLHADGLPDIPLELELLRELIESRTA